MKITQVQIDYGQPTFPGGLSVTDMQHILMQIDWLDGQQVQAATVRCNNRCNGNDTTVKVPLLKVATFVP